jgi:hypothetical protein
MEASLGQRWELVAPGIPALREAVTEDNERSGSLLSDVQAHAVCLDNAVLNLAHGDLHRGSCLFHLRHVVSGGRRLRRTVRSRGVLSAAHGHCLASLASGNILFLQVVLFQKPWRYFCNKALSAAHGHCLASLARGNTVFLQVVLFQKSWRYFCNKALSLWLISLEGAV